MKFRYFIGIFITIGLLIFLITLLASGGKSKSKVPATSKTLQSYASTSAVARLTIDGVTNSVSEHRQIRITVGRDQAKYEEISGYSGNVVNSLGYGNTKDSYTAFLRSIDKAGFTKGNADKASTDYRGYCPLGLRYVFQLIQDGKVLENFWTTGCGKPRTFEGNLGLNVSLFELQIPDYNKLRSKVELQ